MISVAAWFTINLLYARLRPDHCFDCFEPHGVPFTYWHDDGFAGGTAWVPLGILGDLVVVLIIGLL